MAQKRKGEHPKSGLSEGERPLVPKVTPSWGSHPEKCTFSRVTHELPCYSTRFLESLYPEGDKLTNKKWKAITFAKCFLSAMHPSMLSPNKLNSWSVTNLSPFSPPQYRQNLSPPASGQIESNARELPWTNPHGGKVRGIPEFLR